MHDETMSAPKAIDFIRTQRDPVVPRIQNPLTVRLRELLQGAPVVLKQLLQSQ